MANLLWTRSKPRWNYGVKPRTAHKANLPNEKTIEIVHDGIPSMPYTLYYPGTSDCSFTNTLTEAKAEAQRYADLMQPQ